MQRGYSIIRSIYGYIENLLMRYNRTGSIIPGYDKANMNMNSVQNPAGRIIQFLDSRKDSTYNIEPTLRNCCRNAY